MTSEKNVKLNLLKGFACMGVVFIHVLFPGTFGQVVQAASSYAVPIFFMIAGYYAFGKNDAVIRRRALKIGKIFLSAYALFFVFCIWRRDATAFLAENFNWKTPIMYIVFCTIDFAIPLWYLIAMLEIYAVWYSVVRKGREKSLVKLFPALFVLRAALTIYCSARGLDWFWHVNFLAQGMPWFLLGYYLHTDRSEKCRNLPYWILVLMTAGGTLISILPAILHWKTNLSAVGSVSCALGLFLLTLKDPGKSICRPIEYIGERLSLPIYILHVLIDVKFCYYLEAYLKIDTGTTVFAWFRPIIIFTVTVLAAWIVSVCTQCVRSAWNKIRRERNGV